METNIEDIISHKLNKKILRILLTTFKLEINLSTLAIKVGVSRPTLQDRIKILEDANLIHKEKTSIFLTINRDILKKIFELIPVNTDNEYGKIENLKRKLVYQYIDNIDNIDNIELNKLFKKRPNDNFDIKEVMHPAMSISNNLKITEVSNTFYKQFDDLVDNQEVIGRTLLDFFKDANMYIYNFETDTITNEYIYDKIYNGLINEGSINIDIYYKKRDGKEIFLTVFMVIQTNYLGIQSIIPDITNKVLKNRERLRLTHRFYHLINVIKNISDEFNDLNIDNKKYNSLTKKLDKLSSFAYLDTIYASEKSPNNMKIFRDFHLNRNLKSIVEQLRLLYSLKEEVLYFTETKYPIKLSNVYDIYFYEGLYLLIETFIKKANKGCTCHIISNKKDKNPFKNPNHFIEFSFNQEVNEKIISFLNDLKIEIIKNASINKNHLDIKFFIDDMNSDVLLELVISTYFKDIQINFDKKSIIFEIKNKDELQINTTQGD